MSHNPVATYRYIPGPIDVGMSAAKTGINGVVGMVTALALTCWWAIIIGVVMFVVALAVILITGMIILATLGVLAITTYAIITTVRNVHGHIQARRVMMVTTEPTTEE